RRWGRGGWGGGGFVRAGLPFLRVATPPGARPRLAGIEIPAPRARGAPDRGPRLASDRARLPEAHGCSPGRDRAAGRPRRSPQAGEARRRVGDHRAKLVRAYIRSDIALDLRLRLEAVVHSHQGRELVLESHAIQREEAVDRDEQVADRVDLEADRSIPTGQALRGRDELIQSRRMEIDRPRQVR